MPNGAASEDAGSSKIGSTASKRSRMVCVEDLFSNDVFIAFASLLVRRFFRNRGRIVPCSCLM